MTFERRRWRDGMTKRSKKRPSAKPRLDALETRRAVAITVAWTLAVTTTLVCNVGAAATRLWLVAKPEAAGAGLVSGMLLFAAVALGVIVLALLPVVLRVRRQPPPRGYVVFAMLVAAAPLIAAAIKMSR